MKSKQLSLQENPIAGLIGKTIKNISVEEVDLDGDGQNVAQYFTFECTDGSSMVARCESEVSFQYAHLEVMTVSEFNELKEELNDPSENSEHDWEGDDD